MFRTLYSKLAAVLLALFLLVGVISVGATLHFFELYNEESNQRLNLPLAQHLVQQNALGTAGDLSSQRLRSLFDMQMIINPSIQIYLLDADGRIVAFSAAPGEVKLKQIDLAPIRQFTSGAAKLPLLGEDPRDPERRRIFSVAPLGGTGSKGYLYVMLAAERPAGLAGLLAHSDVVPRAALAAAVSVLVALLIGLAIFALMTRKLERLAAAMGEFQRSDFSRRPQLPAANDPGGDEIDRLAISFREMASRISAQLQKLKQNDELRRELVANVSHDLKTPIATLQGYVDTLLLKDASLTGEDRRSYLAIASRSCERLGKMVGDLIELAKLDAQEVALQPEPFSIAELMQDIAQKFDLQAQRKEVHIELDFPSRLPFVVGDIGLIERVLENLIGNAITHTPEGGRVRLGVTLADEEALIQVADTGIGIAQENLTQVFERFFRVSNAGWEKGAHAGLGLAITKSILDLHRSRLTVDSELGAGTVFRFTLPLAQRDVADARAIA
jgi:signal transduction histidine kinase